mmetsp:Transcript_31628/g.38701  ORF Transcript_31628/g.38701 Transcript_31628/m.38701 type:complete len:138 (+) Transcript_31628:1050-1463(+)
MTDNAARHGNSNNTIEYDAMATGENATNMDNCNFYDDTDNGNNTTVPPMVNDDNMTNCNNEWNAAAIYHGDSDTYHHNGDSIYHNNKNNATFHDGDKVYDDGPCDDACDDNNADKDNDDEKHNFLSNALQYFDKFHF